MMITYQLKEVSTRFMDFTAAQKTTIIILDVVTQVFFDLLNLKQNLTAKIDNIMKSSYLTTKFLGSYGYDFRDQDATDYSANGTYSAVGNIIIYRHLIYLYICSFQHFQQYYQMIFFSAPLCSKGE